MDEEQRLLGMLSPEARALVDEIDAAGAVEAAQDDRYPALRRLPVLYLSGLR